ncbi:MAG: radical SAM family heme chaperone HemW [Anaerolineales bacterium]|nr:radical SAM family heme chaperone HemW [Anaerolineales bacterium]
MSAYSLYLHVPFCHHRCGYCDFNTYAGLEGLIPAYVQALRREIELLASSAGRPLQAGTVYFGGGTPSLLTPTQLETILIKLAECFSMEGGVEVTLEANPGTVTLDYLRQVRSLGVNRLSLGVQSADADELRFLEREHTFEDVQRSVAWARAANVTNLSLDLIFGLPGQSLADWKRSLQAALELAPEHISLYALSIEHGTPLHARLLRGEVGSPDPDAAADMYEWASECLVGAGYEQYEISNWARRETSGELLACRHNLQYWRNLPYLGFGAGAHGYSDGWRTVNVLSPAAYIQRCQSGIALDFPRTPATTHIQAVDRVAEIGETMMMGLRLTQEGVQASAFEGRFGEALETKFGRQIADLVAKGLLEWASAPGERLRLTQRGRLLGNQVFVNFV